MKNILLSFFMCLLGASGLMAQDSLGYTGSVQTYIVPPCTDSVNIQTWGAQGGFVGTTAGGNGGEAFGSLDVSSGDTLWVYVGGKGIDSPGGSQACNLAGGWNGGGPTGDTCCSNAGSGAASGGGASDVRYGGQTLNDRVIVAAGGGGAYSSENGAAGGGLVGLDGGSYNGVASTGGTQTSGGQAGGYYTAHTCNRATDGTFGYGGKGDGNDGGGGGAGWYGGGGGANNAGAAGGSSYIGGVDNGSTNTGTNTGNGLVVITPIYDTATVSLNLTGADTLCSSQSPVALSGGSPSGGNYSGTGVSGGNFDPSTANSGWNVITYSYNNCPNPPTDSIFVTTCVGVDEYSFKNEKLVVYPNPASENVFFQLDNNKVLKNARLKISDLKGSVIYSETVNGNKFKVDGNTFESDGVYLFTITAQDQVFSGKIVYKNQ